MPTRSTVLARGIGVNNTWTLLGGPPAGWCWIVKNITATNDGNTTANLDVRVSQKTGGVYVDIIHQDILAKAQMNYSTWLMVMDSDYIYWLPTLVNVGIWVSGTELPMPPALVTTGDYPPEPPWLGHPTTAPASSPSA